MTLPLTLAILQKMRPIQGWLEAEEADLLIAACAWAIASHDPPHTIVEVGSYCGRSTVVMASVVSALSPNGHVYAIDPHQGDVGAADQQIHSSPPTLETFRRNITDAGLANSVEVIVQRSHDVVWTRPITLLLVDGLHDYANVARDFHHFASWIAPGGCAAFHDYANHYPGVITFVDELLGSGDYQKIGQAKTMVVVRRNDPDR